VDYSPLVKAFKMKDPTLNEVANEVGATPAQVLVAFSLARDIVPLPKSANTKRQKENLEAINVQLSGDQMQRLEALEEYLVTDWDPIRDEEV
jgi:diketogulonate reductase-like aldo/keto reductase